MNSTAGPETTQQVPAPMRPAEKERTWMALEAAAAAVLLGSLGNALGRVEPWGINVLLWIGAMVGLLWLVSRHHGVRWAGEGRWLLGVAATFAAMIAWRASEALLVLNLLALLLVLAVAAATTRTGSPRTLRLGGTLWAFVVGAAHAAGGALLLVLGDVRWRDVVRPGRGGTAFALLRGALLALPLLILFGALLASADPVFGGLLDRTVTWNPERLVVALFWTGFWGWLAAGWLRAALLSQAQHPPALLRQYVGPRIGKPETAVVLGSVNLLFFLFVLVQFRYLFGGADLVAYTEGLGYAEYARRGFFELVAVSALVLPVLLGLHALQSDRSRGADRLFRWLAGLLIGLLFMIMASALQRMRLYQQEYGLTELRLYTTVFMAWLAAVFAWFAATALRGRSERFAWGAAVAGLAALGVLNALNPEALIARTNTRHVATAQRLDVAYLTRLGPDAVPVLVHALPHVPLGSRCALAADLAGRASAAVQRPADWRSGNWGRARARAALARAGAGLRLPGCAQPPAAAPNVPPR